jgi:hypothetical protein
LANIHRTIATPSRAKVFPDIDDGAAGDLDDDASSSVEACSSFAAPKPILFRADDIKRVTCSARKRLVAAAAFCIRLHAQLELARDSVELERWDAASAVEGGRQLVSGGEVVRPKSSMVPQSWIGKGEGGGDLNPDAADCDAQSLITAALLASAHTCSRVSRTLTTRLQGQGGGRIAQHNFSAREPAWPGWMAAAAQSRCATGQPGARG